MSKGMLKKGLTNANGDVSFEGDSDENHVTYSLRVEDGNFYPIVRKQLKFDHVSGVISKRWEPYDSTVTVALQRVVHPIPLFVNKVELRDNRNGIGGFDGTNSVLRFDLIKGDWLPPYGNGIVSDVRFTSHVRLKEKMRRFLPQEGTWGDVRFFELANRVEFCEEDFLEPSIAKDGAGIKIRMAAENGIAREAVKVIGKRKVVEANQDWHSERFNDRDPNRCYTFRIRSRRDEKGKLVEAYYGKIYGDFEFEGDEKKGLIGVKFLYYLNPTSLDRNLEWDMKNNLCPNGNVGLRQP